MGANNRHTNVYSAKDGGNMGTRHAPVHVAGDGRRNHILSAGTAAGSASQKGGARSAKVSL